MSYSSRLDKSFKVAASCLNFKTNPCSMEDYTLWKQMGIDLGFTDFDPTTVNWKVPVSWRGEGGCTLENQNGCILPIGGAYGLILGFGAFFTILTVMIHVIEQKVTGVALTSEHFNTAGRNIKIGLTGSVIVSQWTWAATLLQSSNVAFGNGVSGPFWYASGATIQILLFGIIAIEIKRKCPNAHTFLEIVDARWGKAAHATFAMFAMFTNFLVTGMLLVGGAAVMNAASGMSISVAGTLMTFVVIVYTLVGGLKSTFMAGYLHTSIIMIILCIMITAVYYMEGDALGICKENEQCNSIGSSGVMWERLMMMTKLNYPGTKQGPVSGNKGGSYLTMMSSGGVMFGVMNTVGNFGTVFVDQSYWQSAIAASPSSAHKGYILGGLVWFAIPFSLATSLGLAGIALNGKISGGEAGAGLVPPAAATILMGPAGGILMILALLMAILSTGSAEMIAVSSLLTYDLYRKYINPSATGDQILKWSRIFCFAYGIFFMPMINLLFDAFRVPGRSFDILKCTWIEDTVNPPSPISMGWIYVFMGNMIGSAVCPVAAAIMWKDLPAWGAVAGGWLGLIGSIISWIAGAASPSMWGKNMCVDVFDEATGRTWPVCASSCPSGEVNYQSLGLNEPLLMSNLLAICISGFICLVAGLVAPQNYDWKQMSEKVTVIEETKATFPEWELSEEYLSKASAWVVKYGGGYTLFMVIIWPFFLAMPMGVMPKGAYAIWVGVSFTWGWTGTIVIVSLPLYENFANIKNAFLCKTSAPASEPKSVETSTA
jgi:SSS family transporter